MTKITKTCCKKAQNIRKVEKSIRSFLFNTDKKEFARKTTKNISMLLLATGIVLTLFFVQASSKSYAQCVQVPSGIVSWWPGDGNTDDILNGNNATLLKGTTFNTGQVGQAFSLDGIDDYIEAPDAASLRFNDQTPFTIEMWAKPNSSNSQEIIAKWGGSSSQFGYGIAIRSGFFQFAIDKFGCCRDTLLGTTAISANTWHHFAATYDGTTMKIYVNGILDGNKAKTISGSTFSSSPVRIGIVTFEGGTNFGGLMDEISIYNQALSASEVQTIHNAGSAGKCKSGPAPSLTSISPNSGLTGQVVNVTLTGTNFESGISAVVSGTGITVTNVNMSSSTSATATFTIDSSAITGVRTVSVTTTGGTSNTVNFTINAPAPVAAFSADITNGITPLTVNFTDQSTGSINAWAWNFGDGSSSTLQHSSNTYSTAGNFTVTLTVTGPGGSHTETKTGFITVSAAITAPIAQFTATPTSGAAPLTVNFTDQSTGSINTWAWNFGDGSSGTQQHPSNTYSGAGNFTVSLTVTGTGGSDSETKTGFITISQSATPTPTHTPEPTITPTHTPGPTPTPTPIQTPLTPTPTPTPVVCKAPISEFKADKTSILEGEEIKFTDLSENNPSSWIWDFGDGSAPASNQNPSHVYNNAGKFSVTLTTSNTCGEDKEIKTNLIETLSTIVAPKADFSGNPTSGLEPLIVEFLDKSTGAPTSWVWGFGDGDVSNERNPFHTYNIKGIYTVELMASNSAGSDSIEKVNLINVIGKAAPIADFSANPTAGIVPLDVVFENKSTGDPTSWVWELGDGAVSIEENPQHTYNSAGIFTIGLLASNSEGADWEIKTNLVNVQSKNKPTAAFTATPQAGITPMTVIFTDISEGDPESWIWQFGDGGISSLQNTQHTYRAEGFFSVSLTVSNANGIDIENQVNLINVQGEGVPVAEFIAEPLTGFAQLTVAFTDISNGNIENWSWDFGDGGISSSQNPTHSYKSQGIFSVELIVSGSSGTDSEKKTNLINVIDSGASGQPGDLSAAFKASDRIGPAGLEVEFENLSSGEISGWLWDFGDNTTSDKEDLDHTYNTEGVYTVSLSVFNNGGKADTITKPAYIEIKEEEEEIVVTPTPKEETPTPTPEITPTPGPKKCFASDVLDEGNDNELDTIRGFRDGKLSKTMTGLRLIKLYYKHSGEVTEIVNQDEGLRFRISTVLMDLVKAIDQSDSDTSFINFVQDHIPAWLDSEINALVDEIAQKGSDELREAIKETYDLLKE